jgi:hypothetical protein
MGWAQSLPVAGTLGGVDPHILASSYIDPNYIFNTAWFYGGQYNLDFQLNGYEGSVPEPEAVSLLFAGSSVLAVWRFWRKSI